MFLITSVSGIVMKQDYITNICFKKQIYALHVATEIELLSKLFHNVLRRQANGSQDG